MHRLVPALWLLAAACQPTITGNANKDTGSPPADDTADTDTDDTAEVNPCAPSGVCELDISSATAECGDGDADHPRVTASAASDGTVTATLTGMEWGCCPTVEAGGSAAWDTRRIDLSMVTYGDDCDCVCALDGVIVFSGAPTGDYTLVFNGQETALSVP